MALTLNDMISNSVLGLAKTNPQNVLNEELSKVVEDHGLRPDKTKKGKGFFGPLERPFGGGYSTELSTTVGLDGKDVLIPLLVPTLNRDEVNYLLSTNPEDPIPGTILDKAVGHANFRMLNGLSPFASDEEIPFGIKIGD